jgi:hypothetical protein
MILALDLHHGVDTIGRIVSSLITRAVQKGGLAMPAVTHQRESFRLSVWVSQRSRALS